MPDYSDEEIDKVSDDVSDIDDAALDDEKPTKFTIQASDTDYV
jgi:hypothetical protein